SSVDSRLNTQVSGTLGDAAEGDTYSFTVTPGLGSGRLTANVAAADTLLPRLTLLGSDNQVLVQSSNGSIEQHLPPGTYGLIVSVLHSVRQLRSGGGPERRRPS